jgi:hypothetical protein
VRTAEGAAGARNGETGLAERAAPGRANVGWARRAGPVRAAFAADGPPGYSRDAGPRSVHAGWRARVAFAADGPPGYRRDAGPRSVHAGWRARVAFIADRPPQLAPSPYRGGRR